MSRIHLWTLVEASPEEVWEVVANPRNLPRWNRHVRAVTGVPENGLAPGTRYTTELGAMALRFHIEAEVVELERPRYAQVRLHGPVDATVRTWIHRAGRRRSRLEHEVDYHLKGGPLGEAIARVFKLLGGTQLLRRGLHAQKKQVEEG